MAKVTWGHMVFVWHFLKMAVNTVLFLAIQQHRLNDSIKPLRLYRIAPVFKHVRSSWTLLFKAISSRTSCVVTRMSHYNTYVSMATQEFTPFRCHISLCKQTYPTCTHLGYVCCQGVCLRFLVTFFNVNMATHVPSGDVHVIQMMICTIMQH